MWQPATTTGPCYDSEKRGQHVAMIAEVHTVQFDSITLDSGVELSPVQVAA